MPEYLSPGVYVEEIDAGAKPIEGVSTSTCGAVGVTQRGPTTGKPVLVTGFLEFERRFGGLLPEPPATLMNILEGRWWQFPLSVKGFFDNGGQRLFVKRVFSSTAQSATLLLARGVIAEIIRDAPVGADRLRLRHTIGIDNGTNIRLFVAGSPVGNFTVNSYTATGEVVLNNAVAQELVAGRDFVEIVARAATPAPPPDFRLTVQAKASGDWGGNEVEDNGITAGNGLRTRVRPVVTASLRILASPTVGGNPASTTVAVDAPAGATEIQVAGAAGFASTDSVQIADGEFIINSIPGRFDIPAAAAAIAANTAITEGGNPRGNVVGGVPVGGTRVYSTDISNLANGDTVDIGGTPFVIANVTPTRVQGFDIAPPAAAVIPIGTPITEGGNPRGNLIAEVPIGGTRVLTTDVTNLANGDTVDIGGAPFTISNVTPAAIVFNLNNPVPAGRTWTVGTAIRRMRRAIDPAPATANIINVQNALQLYAGAIVELDTGSVKEERTVDSVLGDAVTLSAAPTATYFEGFRVRLIEGEVSAQYRRNHIIVDEETYSNLRFIDDGGPNYIVRRVNLNSELISLVGGADFAGSVSQIAEFPIIPAPAAGPVGFWGDLTGGRDNLAALSVDDFVGVEGGSEASTGVQALEFIDEISICLAPGIWASPVHNSLTTHCETLKDRFAILDPPDDLDIEGIRDFREPLDTKYAALYYPWLVVRDSLLKRDVHLAPSGHMAGIYARVDVERGVHKAPANEVVRGIRLPGGFVRDVSKREQDLLNPRNINALRAFPGRGQRVWGARVLTSDASWKYINVRRLFIFVEESIDEGTQWVVFEPNDEPLWARVRATISNFLLTVWRSGALEGTKPEEAYFVKCDLTTMTQADIDNGRLICIIGIAPVKPAEFVIFRIQQKTREATGV